MLSRKTPAALCGERDWRSRRRWTRGLFGTQGSWLRRVESAACAKNHALQLLLTSDQQRELPAVGAPAPEGGFDGRECWLTRLLREVITRPLPGR